MSNSFRSKRKIHYSVCSFGAHIGKFAACMVSGKWTLCCHKGSHPGRKKKAKCSRPLLSVGPHCHVSGVCLVFLSPPPLQIKEYGRGLRTGWDAENELGIQRGMESHFLSPYTYLKSPNHIEYFQGLRLILMTAFSNQYCFLELYSTPWCVQKENLWACGLVVEHMFCM